MWKIIALLQLTTMLLIVWFSVNKSLPASVFTSHDAWVTTSILLALATSSFLAGRGKK